MQLAPALLGVVAINCFAFQPWAEGVKPLVARIAEIDQAISINQKMTLSESVTDSDMSRLAAEQEKLIQERANLKRMLDTSVRVKDSGLVNYAKSSDGRVNSTLPESAQATQEEKR